LNIEYFYHMSETPNLKPFAGYTPTWCPGCGDWAIRMAIQTALTKLNYTPSDVMVSFDIGCSGNMNDFLNAYAMHGLHGRSIPTAVGFKLANEKMPVLVIGGDGGIYGEGGNHFMHAARGNHDMTVIVHDNMVYGLTTGQVAPTSHQGTKSKSTPAGIIEVSVNPLALAITQGATFVAQAFAGDMQHAAEMIRLGIEHKGFALVNILQPCVTFNKVNTYQYYLPRVYKVGPDHHKEDYMQAMAKANELTQEKFPTGVIYQIEKPAYHEYLGQIPKGETLLSRERYTQAGNLLEEFV
jgi:2-oxoglutarate ferredoxin oxidoreductase subunit beta